MFQSINQMVPSWHENRDWFCGMISESLVIPTFPKIEDPFYLLDTELPIGDQNRKGCISGEK